MFMQQAVIHALVRQMVQEASWMAILTTTAFAMRTRSAVVQMRQLVITTARLRTMMALAFHLTLVAYAEVLGLTATVMVSAMPMKFWVALRARHVTMTLQRQKTADVTLLLA